MKHAFHRSEHDMTVTLFFRLLQVQAAIVAMGSINAIADGIVAARFIDTATLGVVGLYYTMMRVLEASGSIVLGGVSVLSGRYLGSCRTDRARGVCSLGIVCELVIGGGLTAVSFAAPGALADLLGANAALREPLMAYIRGYAIGIIPMLLAQQLASWLQLERQEKRGNLGIAVMIVTNVALNIVFVTVLRMGVWGLALSTSLANLAYFLILAQYFLTDRVQMRPSLRLIDWRELPRILRIGFPNALLVVCLGVRSIFINRLLLNCSGQDGLSALSAFNMVVGLILAFDLGNGAAVRMLSSVFIGEENRESLLSLIKLVLTRVMAIVLVIGLALFLLAPTLAAIFFPDTASDVWRLSEQLFRIYSICVPMALLLITYSNYCQAAGHQFYVNLISVVDGFFSMLIPAMLLAPRMGALGVWLSLPLGMLITIAVTIVYVVQRGKRWPRSLEDWLLLPPRFGEGERLVLTLRKLEDVSLTAEAVQHFCKAHAITDRRSTAVGLCLEEMAQNIVRHGFRADRRQHVIDLRVIIREQNIILRIKDDCIPFNPNEWYAIMSPADPTVNIGIRLVFHLADEIEYRNLLGLNVLTIRLEDHV